jgi:hypothetical protein
VRRRSGVYTTFSLPSAQSILQSINNQSLFINAALLSIALEAGVWCSTSETAAVINTEPQVSMIMTLQIELTLTSFVTAMSPSYSCRGAGPLRYRVVDFLTTHILWVFHLPLFWNPYSSINPSPQTYPKRQRSQESIVVAPRMPFIVIMIAVPSSSLLEDADSHVVALQ